MGALQWAGQLQAALRCIEQSGWCVPSLTSRLGGSTLLRASRAVTAGRSRGAAGRQTALDQAATSLSSYGQPARTTLLSRLVGYNQPEVYDPD